MTDEPSSTPGSAPGQSSAAGPTARTDDSDTQAKIIYVLYLAGFIFPITPVIGLVMAYLARGDAGEVLRSHYRFQIRTFWIGCLYLLIGSVLAFVFIGFLVLLAEAIWYIVRCVKGLQALAREEAVQDVETWIV